MTELDISVDLAAAEPPYEQVRAQLAGYIVGGALPEGERLPPIRILAADLGLATNTVGRAYKELEAAGLVTTRRRTGTIVTGRQSLADPVLGASATAYARSALRAGLSESAALDLVRAALRAASPG